MQTRKTTKPIVNIIMIVLMLTQISATTRPAPIPTAADDSPAQAGGFLLLKTSYGAKDTLIGGAWTGINLVSSTAAQAGTASRVQFKYALAAGQVAEIEFRITNGSAGTTLPLPVQNVTAQSTGTDLGEISGLAGLPAEGPWELEARVLSGEPLVLTSGTLLVEQYVQGKPLTDEGANPGVPTFMQLPEGWTASTTPDDTQKINSPAIANSITTTDSVITTETFEGLFPGTDWTVFDDNSSDGLEYYWDDEPDRPYTGSWAGWPAGDGANALDPSGYYADNMDSWMVYGPFDLSDASAARTVFYRWQVTEAGYDDLFFGASIDGSNFSGLSWSGDSGGWIEETVNYDDYVGYPSVWVAWVFTSDSSITMEGPWIDDITVYKTTGSVSVCGPYTSSPATALPQDGEWLLEQIRTPDTLPADAKLSDVNIKFGITAASPSSLELELVHVQSGISVPLSGLSTPSGEGLEASLNLKDFKDLPPSDWLFKVRDAASAVGGTLDYITIHPNYQFPSQLPLTTVQGAEGIPAVRQIPTGQVWNSTPRDNDPAKTAPQNSGTSLPLGWNTIITEGFEGDFPSGSWSVNDNSNDGCDFQWDDDDNRPYAGSWAAWPANGGADGLDPAFSTYPPYMDSWMVYGPFDLSDATDARVTFKSWLQTEAGYDQLFFGVSSDGVTYNGFYYEGSQPWTSQELNFSTYTGDSTVWIAFNFYSDGSVNYEGPWVDEILLEKYTGFIVGDCTNGYSGAARLSPEELLDAYADAINASKPVLEQFTQPYEVLLASRQFVPEEGMDASLQALERSAGAGQAPVHLLLQFYESPTPAQKLELEAQGIRLLHYIPRNTWIASVDAESLPALSSERGIRWSGVLTPEDRTSAFLASEALRSFYANSDGTLPLMVEFAQDIPLAAARRLVEGYGGVVESEVLSINSLLVVLPEARFTEFTNEDSLIWIEPPLPRLQGLNDCVRRKIGGDSLQGTYGLNGSGVDMLVYDAGTVATTHDAFTGRLTVGDASGTDDHATHVAGTAAGDGTGSPLLRDLKGMAPAVDIISYGFQWSGTEWLYTNPGDIESDWNTAKNTYGADQGTASIGTNTASNGFPCDWEGNYGAVSQLIDSIVRGSLGEPYIATWAAGNERGGTARCGSGYNTTAPPAGAKNPIHVGATFSDSDVITWFSSFGPTDDGRIKPTISAPGCEQGGEQFVNSTLPTNTYGEAGYCGTSMSTPAVAGLASLMIQQYRSSYSTSGEPLPSTVKALLIHTAVDKGNAGPDYQYGYGRVDGVSAVDAIIAGDFREESITVTNEYHDYSYYSSGILPLKVSLAWDDVGATPSATIQLVNDLDLVLISPSGVSYYPFILNPASPSATATTGADHLNNQEQVIIPSPQAGTWTIRVRAYNLPTAPQSYSIVFDNSHYTTPAKRLPQTLTVSKTGTGSGTVTSSPAGINCGADCSETYAYGTVVTLTASASAGSLFSGWSGSGCSGTGTCVVTMDAARSVTANFIPLTYTLTVSKTGSGTGTVTSSPSGINCGADCTEIYNSNTVVTLTAAPAVSSNFTGWSGAGCSGTGTCVVTMDASKSVTANFDIKTFTLTVNKTGSGSGTVTSSPPGINCGGDCSETYTYGTVVTLTAVPTTGSVFSGWSGAGCAGTGSCVVTMDAAKSVTASFTILTYPLSVSKTGTGTGTVTSSPSGINCGADCSETYNHGTVVTLTAAPSAGSTFTSWSGAGCSGTGTCVVTMDAAKSVTANFNILTYTLTVNKTGTGSGTVTSSPSGINCGADCSENYIYNTVVTLYATPAAGSTFTGWSGAGCSGTGNCVVTMDAAKSVTANFNIQTFILTVSKTGSGSGTVTSSPPGIDCGAVCSETYDYGTVVTLTASPAAGSNFTGWSGAGCSGTGTCVVSMTAARSVTAIFTIQTFPLTVSRTGTGTGTVTSSPSGINCGADCSETYNYGTVVTLTAAPAVNSNFTGWSGACSGTDPCVVTMDAARSVTANFDIKTFTLTVLKDGTGSGTVTSSPSGINCGADCSETYNYGTVVTLSNSLMAGSVFGGWSGACSGTGACNVTMISDKTVTATFNIQTFLLTVNRTGTGSGTVTSSPPGIDCGADCTEMYDYSTLVTLTPEAAPGSAFAGWSGACSGTGSCVVTMTAARTVTAIFNIQTFTLTVSKAGTGIGTVTSSPPGINCGADCSQVYNYNTVVTLTATPAAGSIFTGWSGACSGTGTCIVTMLDGMSVTASFDLVPGAFNKIAPANGSSNQPLNLDLVWGSSSNAEYYEYCYDESNDNSCSAWYYNGLSTSVSLYALSEYTTYYWHVRAVNSYDTTYANGSATAFWSFTTSETGAFNKSSPADGAVNQTTTPTLSWGASQDVTSYEYCYDTTDDDACLTWTNNGFSTSVPLTGLAFDTTYYWQVRANNPGGTVYANGSETAFWSFRTKGKLTVRSTNTQDGWILESAENSNLGGTMDSAATTLRLGDDAAKKQYRSILSFATGATLPDNAVITKVTLKVKRQAVVGTIDPVAALQGFMLDVRKGIFGTSSVLQLPDWQALATKTVGPFVPAPSSGWYTLNLTGAKGAINKLATGSGLTQIRLRFKLDDNNNTIANYLSLFSGNYGTATARPTLIVEYYVP